MGALIRAVNGSISIAMKNPRRPGRPLSFDLEAALDQAMLAFWRNGYEATSLRDLTAAMGVTAPSIYAAFGDKRALFDAALRHYVGDPPGALALIAQAPSARQASEALLAAAAAAYTGEATPPGCLLAKASVGAPADLASTIAAIRAGIEAALRARMEEAPGALPPGCDAPAMAALVMAIIQGMAVLAHDGAPREKLLAIARASMRAWPNEEPPDPCP